MSEAAMNISRDTGGYDEDEDAVFPASFGCRDCGLYYSWPVTPGLAPNADPLQTEMLALVNAHTPAACRAAQASAAIEREKEMAAEAAETYEESQNVITRVNEIAMKVEAAVKNEVNGYPMPIGGDRRVSLQQAIELGAVTITKGLPEAVAWRRSNPSLDGTYRVRWLAGAKESLPVGTFLWPGPSHQALTDSITALAATQRRLMIGSRLAVAR